MDESLFLNIKSTLRFVFHRDLKAVINYAQAGNNFREKTIVY